MVVPPPNRRAEPHLTRPAPGAATRRLITDPAPIFAGPRTISRDSPPTRTAGRHTRSCRKVRPLWDRTLPVYRVPAQKADSGMSMRELSVASAIARSEASRGRTVRAKKDAAATLPV